MKDYRQGLLDAIEEIEAELSCAELEYSDSEICRKTAYRVLWNACLLAQDKIAMLTA